VRFHRVIASLGCVAALLTACGGGRTGGSENVGDVAPTAPTIATATPFVPEPSHALTQPAPEPIAPLKTPVQRVYTDQLWTPAV
jgi:hypothetical protein